MRLILRRKKVSSGAVTRVVGRWTGGVIWTDHLVLLESGGCYRNIRELGYGKSEIKHGGESRERFPLCYSLFYNQ